MNTNKHILLTFSEVIQLDIIKLYYYWMKNRELIEHDVLLKDYIDVKFKNFGIKDAFK